jgi:hypothetical protein
MTAGCFFCGISRDTSFFKPYTSGTVENYYRKHSLSGRESYLDSAVAAGASQEAYVYKAEEYSRGLIQVAEEPRGSFLADQKDFHVVCVRTVYQGQFLGEIYLHRSKDKPDFDDEEMFVLRLLQPHISTVFNIIHTVTAVKYLETAGEAGSQKGLCLFDGELSLIGGIVSGIEILKNITVFGSSVLYHIKEFCLDLLGNGRL